MKTEVETERTIKLRNALRSVDSVLATRFWLLDPGDCVELVNRLDWGRLQLDVKMALRAKGEPTESSAVVRLIVSDGNFEGIRGTCNACGQSVASYLCNASLIAARPEAAAEDYWLACTNPACSHSYGCGYLQDEPDWYTYAPVRKGESL